MLFFKRLATAIAVFCVLFVFLYFGTLIIGGAVVGARAGMANPNNAPQAGYEAGVQFNRQYGSVILLGAFGISAAVSLALSFSGAFPWCRRAPIPPQLP